MPREPSPAAPFRWLLCTSSVAASSLSGLADVVGLIQTGSGTNYSDAQFDNSSLAVEPEGARLAELGENHRTPADEPGHGIKQKVVKLPTIPLSQANEWIRRLKVFQRSAAKFVTTVGAISKRLEKASAQNSGEVRYEILELFSHLRQPVEDFNRNYANTIDGITSEPLQAKSLPNEAAAMFNTTQNETVEGLRQAKNLAGSFTDFFAGKASVLEVATGPVGVCTTVDGVLHELRGTAHGFVTINRQNAHSARTLPDRVPPELMRHMDSRLSSELARFSSSTADSVEDSTSHITRNVANFLSDTLYCDIGDKSLAGTGSSLGLLVKSLVVALLFSKDIRHRHC